MLKNLLIRNYALIESVEAEFERGLNILTGETGAGKSIIIDALNLLLGERASADEVRKGADKAIVEGCFGITGHARAQAFLKDHELDLSDDLIVRREISSKGQSRAFVNDTPVTIQQLKALGDLLVDLHGQHEHQSLLRVDTHLRLIDDFAGLEGLRGEFEQAYRACAALYDRIDELRRQERQLKEKRELYAFQIDEIDAVNPHTGEEEELESEIRILENAEKLFQSTSQLHQVLYEGEQSLYDQLVLARNQLEELARIDAGFEESTKECASAVAIVDELSKFVQQYNAKIEFNAERLEQLRERLGRLILLKKKYGGTVDTLLEHREKIGREFALAENFEEEIKRLNGEIESARKISSAAAERLSAKRREYAGKINDLVAEDLAKLGMPRVRFDVKIDNAIIDQKAAKAGTERIYVKLGKECYEATPEGIDIVEFYISTNLGEELKPLVRVASGGEISRIMLSLKSILARTDRLPVMVFDEIDVGISGRVAQAVGKSLKNLSKYHQIVVITHLPQIAGLADVQFVVEKKEEKKRTVTHLRKLDLEERVREVAKLMSGSEVTDAGLAGARELMGMK